MKQEEIGKSAHKFTCSTLETSESPCPQCVLMSTTLRKSKTKMQQHLSMLTAFSAATKQKIMPFYLIFFLYFC